MKKLQYHCSSSFFLILCMEHNAKNICKKVTGGKCRIQISELLNLKFTYFFVTVWVFWPHSVLFQGLESRFWKSVLFHTFKTAWEPCEIIKLSSKNNTRTGSSPVGQGGTNSRALNHLGATNHCGVPNHGRGRKKSQQFNKYFLQCSTFASERP